MHLRSRLEALDLSQVHDVAGPGVDGVQAGTGPVLVVEGAERVVRERRFEVHAEAVGEVFDSFEQPDVVPFEQEFAHLLPHDQPFARVVDQVVGLGHDHASH